MNLIKDSKDERLSERGSLPDYDGCMCLVDSLRAALSRAEAAEKERDEARGMVCRARELNAELRAAEEGQNIYNPIPEYRVAAIKRFREALERAKR